MIRKVLITAVAACSLGLLAFGCDMNHQNDKPAADTSMTAPKGDIIDVATGPGMERVTTLVKAVQAADLVDTLKQTGPFTVFAPTNEAFAKLPAGTLDDLLKPENKEKLRSILLYHVVLGRHPANEVAGMNSVKTAQGEELKIAVTDNRVTVGNSKGMATVIKTDVPASNGVIHWVDTVLMP